MTNVPETDARKSGTNYFGSSSKNTFFVELHTNSDIFLYRESPDSAVSNSAVPDLVRFQNRTKLSKFPDIVRFFPEKLPIFVPKWSRFGQNIKVPV